VLADARLHAITIAEKAKNGSATGALLEPRMDPEHGCTGT
jgi:hypothetical protein